MSVPDHDRSVRCDGDNCTNRALLPVALRSTTVSERDIRGWLFVQKGHRTSHFCPQCAELYLTQNDITLRGTALAPETAPNAGSGAIPLPGR